MSPSAPKQPAEKIDIDDPEAVAARLPQFEILGLLGRGGMGVVYKARQKNLDRLVALKILPPEFAADPAFAERFSREAKALARLNHPNIVSVHDFGECGGLFFFSMELVDGANLRELITARRLSAEEALAIVPKICEALQFAHEEGLMHRDIKPENILLDKKGRVKIADFGLAKILGREADNFNLTLSGMALGTPRYMAPEQIDKPQTVDHRADIYSLGVVFYEMLTGELPMGRFAPPSQKVQVDVRLDEIVLHALEREVERRYQHVSEIKTDVERVTAKPAPPAPQAAPGSSKPLAVFVRTALWFTLIIGGIIFSWPDTWTTPSGSFGSLRTVTVGSSVPWLEWRDEPFIGHSLHTNFFTWSAFAGLCALIAAAGLRAGRLPPATSPARSAPAVPLTRAVVSTGRWQVGTTVLCALIVVLSFMPWGNAGRAGFKDQYMKLGRWELGIVPLEKDVCAWDSSLGLKPAGNSSGHWYARIPNWILPMVAMTILALAAARGMGRRPQRFWTPALAAFGAGYLFVVISAMVFHGYHDVAMLGAFFLFVALLFKSLVEVISNHMAADDAPVQPAQARYAAAWLLISGLAGLLPVLWVDWFFKNGDIAGALTSLVIIGGVPVSLIIIAGAFATFARPASRFGRECRALAILPCYAGVVIGLPSALYFLWRRRTSSASR